MAQLDGYSVHSPGAANHMDLLVQYTSGERIAATGMPPQNNKYFNEEWFLDFFRNLSGAFGNNIFTDSFKERARAGQGAEYANWNGAVNNAGNDTSDGAVAVQGNTAAAQNNNPVPAGSWQCSACGQMNTGPFCSECGSVRPKE